MSLAAKTSVLVVLALLGGVGAAYAPVPTFAAVAATFALGLWSFTRDGRPSSVGPRAAVNAEREASPRSTLTAKLVSGYLLVWWLALIAPIAAYSPREESSVDVTQAASTGSLPTQVLVSTFGLVGALFLPAAIKRFDRAFRWPVALWTLYLGWAAASLIWSVYPPATFRNVVAFVLVSVGCFGLGAGFYGRLPNGRDLLLRHVFWAGVLSALVVLLPLPFRFQQYDLLDPSGRLAIGGDFGKYVVGPAMCALLALAATAILGVRRWQRRDWFWVAVFVLPLLALKTRGPFFWGMLALGIFYLLYKTRVQDRVLQAGLLFVIGVGTYVFYSAGVLGWLVPYMARGNVEATMNLTGRVPLWQVLIGEVGQHPWLGAGFAAFWGSPDRFQVIQLTAPSAHNGYLEELLNTGVVGLAILLTFCFCVMAVVLSRARRGDPLGWMAFLFLLYYMLLNLTNALIQEYLEVPLMMILAILGLMASRRAPDPPRAPTAARRRVAAPPR